MKIRMLVSIAGNADPRYNLTEAFAFGPGQELDLHKDLAAAWIASGTAEAIKPAKPAKPATAAPQEPEQPAEAEAAISEPAQEGA